MFLQGHHIVLQKFWIRHDRVLSICQISEKVSDSESIAVSHPCYKLLYSFLFALKLTNILLMWWITAVNGVSLVCLFKLFSLYAYFPPKLA